MDTITKTVYKISFSEIEINAIRSVMGLLEEAQNTLDEHHSERLYAFAEDDNLSRDEIITAWTALDTLLNMDHLG